VAKRLSQCLNPALPSGVHARALEVYSHILLVIRPDGLRRDLQIWSPGLLPFFQFASTSTKPSLLNLLDKHYLPLNEDLRPILKSLILALLPGLEEETGEFFDKVLILLDSISKSVSRQFFFENLWLAMITMPSIRLSALNYLSRKLPNDLNEMNEKSASEVIGKDLGLMVKGLISGLEDKENLVQRATLEILGKHFRPSTKVFKNGLKIGDKVGLIRSLIGITNRRDLSLNRRLYSWLLGNEDQLPGGGGNQNPSSPPNSSSNKNSDSLTSSESGQSLSNDQEEENKLDYLREWSLDLLKKALISEMLEGERKILEEDREEEREIEKSFKSQFNIYPDKTSENSPASSNSLGIGSAKGNVSGIGNSTGITLVISSQEILRPYRVFISLLDKYEIGQPLTSVLILDALKILSRLLNSSSSSSSNTNSNSYLRRKELETTGKMLFDSVDPYALYRQFFLKLQQTLQINLKEEPGIGEKDGYLDLLKFVLLQMQIHDDETRQIHLPILFSGLLDLADQRIAHLNQMASSNDLDSSLELKELRLIEKIFDVSALLLEAIPARVFVRVDEQEEIEAKQFQEKHVDESDISCHFISTSSNFYLTEEAPSDESALLNVGFQKSENLKRLLQLCSSLSFKFSELRKERPSQSSTSTESDLLDSGERTPTGDSKSPQESQLEKLEILNLLISSSFKLSAHLLQLIDDSENPNILKTFNIVQKPENRIGWDLKNWKNLSLELLNQSQSFDEVQFSVEALISAVRCRAIALVSSKSSREKKLESNVSLLNNRRDIEILVEKILKYLDPGFSVYHIRATQLFWEVVSIDGKRHVESVLCGSLTEVDGEERIDACDAFGTLWRLSGEFTPRGKEAFRL